MKTDQERQQFAREAAERAQARLDEVTAGLARLVARRLRRDEALIRREIRLGADELTEFEREQRGDSRLDAGDDAAFMREQLVPMLKEGWTLEELAGVGITRETLSELGILHHLKR
ncbi:MAG TPA: hypothetical protein VF613_13775 [Longimicrobium sp.]|jgi:hypothetical protein